MYHNVRIHLDEVQSLGIFVEFEGVLATGADSAQTRRHIDRLHDALGIKPNDHVSGSYADLLGI